MDDFEAGHKGIPDCLICWKPCANYKDLAVHYISNHKSDDLADAAWDYLEGEPNDYQDNN